MGIHHLLVFIYLSLAFYLVRKKDLALTLFVLIYSGPVSAVALHLLYPEQFLMGGGRVYLQTYDNTLQLMVISLLGLLGLALSYLQPSQVKLLREDRFELKLSKIEVVFWLMVGFSIIYYIMPSIKIYHAGYHYSLAAQNELPGIKVGRVIGHAILLVVFISALKYQKEYRYFVIGFIMFTLLYLEILSGVRSEAVGVAIALLVYIDAVSSSKIKFNYDNKRKYIYLFLFMVAALAYLIGKTRTGGVIDFRNFSTFEAVASTFLSAVQLIESGYTNYFYGQTYIDLLWQTLPASVSPDRPLVPAQYILTTPLRASGGAFVAGTAYMNFGYFGPFLVMFFLGRFLQIARNSMINGNVLSTIIYLSFVMSFFRLMYYSELSSYKMIIVGIAVFGMIWTISWFLKITVLPTYKVSN